MKRLAAPLLAVCIALAAAASPQPTAAQDSMNIAAVVNDDVITMIDVTVRMRLAMLSAKLENTPETRQKLLGPVVRSLIDEKLRGQAAAEAGIEVPEGEVQGELANIAQKNGVTVQKFSDDLARAGILIDSLAEQIRVDIAWVRLIQSRFRSNISIAEQDIQSELAKLARDLNQPEYRIFEIILPVFSSDEAGETQRVAQGLADQARQGADFSALARQFSQSPTGPTGGDLGWVRLSQADPLLADAIAPLQPGQIAGPIAIPSGFAIFQLAEKRAGSGSAGAPASVRLLQVLIPVTAGAGADEETEAFDLARSIQDQAQSCDDLSGLAGQLGDTVARDTGLVPLVGLPQGLQGVAQNQPLNAATAPQRVEGGIGLIMVCERVGGASTADRDVVVQRLTRQRLQTLATGFLTDLRNQAFIDIRL